MSDLWECLGETLKTPWETSSRPGQRMLCCSRALVETGVATFFGVWELGPCDTGAKAAPCMAGELLSFKFANAVYIVVSRS